MVKSKRVKEILELVESLKVKHRLHDPGKICTDLEIQIRKITLNPHVFKAYNNIPGNRSISLNVRYDLCSQFLMCAHELGHILLHEEGYNCFSKLDPVAEYEADLFAVALTFDLSSFDEPIESLSPERLHYELESHESLNPNGLCDYRYYPNISY